MLHRLRYEMRILGIGVFGLPIVMALVFLGVSLLAAYDARQTGGSQAQAHGDMALGLLFLVEVGLPLVAGLVAANLVTSSPAIELHLTMRRSYAEVVWLRLALFALWIALLGVATTTLVRATGYWIAPQPAPLDQLTWAAPALWLLGLGAALSLLLRSRIASGAILGMLWIGELAFRFWFLENGENWALRRLYLFLTLETLPHGMAPDSAYWRENRLVLLGAGVVFLALVAALLRRNESLLGPEA